MVNIPERENDTIAEFARQQEEIARQVSKAKSKKMDEDLAKLLEGK